jgi:hypothetical protein
MIQIYLERVMQSNNSFAFMNKIHNIWINLKNMLDTLSYVN